MSGTRRGSAAILLIATLTVTASVQAQQAQPQPPAAPPPPMSFFVTSVGLGDGANLGGLAGADKHCQALAQAVGAGNRTWRAYLSQTAAGATLPVNARDRIGSGPWYNAKSVIIAASVDELHGDSQRDRNNIRKPIALNEKGEVVTGSGDTPNVHDILTGSDSHGTCPDRQTRRDHLRQLDEQCGGQRHGRPSRSAGRSQRLVECGASDQWLQPAEPGEHGWRRPALLLRRELNDTRQRTGDAPARSDRGGPLSRRRGPIRPQNLGETLGAMLHRAPAPGPPAVRQPRGACIVRSMARALGSWPRTVPP